MSQEASKIDVKLPGRLTCIANYTQNMSSIRTSKHHISTFHGKSARHHFSAQEFMRSRFVSTALQRSPSQAYAFVLAFFVAAAFCTFNYGYQSVGASTTVYVRNEYSSGAKLPSLAFSEVTRRLESTTQEQATIRAREVGTKIRNGIKKLRGGTTKFYNDLITAVQITLCEQDDTKKVRFVSSSDDRAYKYDNGTCIRLVNAVDSTTISNYYTQHLCEVKPNCYWADFDPSVDTDRATVYAESETMTADDAKAKIKSYAQSVGMFAAPGVILAVLSLLTMFFFLLCRCCCNKCGGRKPREGGYTCMEKFLPVLFFFLFGVGIAACAGAAFLYRDTALESVSDTFDSIDGTIDDGRQWTYNLSDPLEDIRDTVLNATQNISTTLSGLYDLSSDIDTFVGLLEVLSTDVSNIRLPANCTSDDPVCLNCTVCASIGDAVSTSANQIDDNAAPAVDQLDSVHEQIDELLVSVAQEVRNQVNTQVDKIASARITLDDTQGQIDDVKKYFVDYKGYIGIAILAIFAIGLVVVVIGLVGVLFGLTPIKLLANFIHLAYFIGFIALFVCFLISAIALALSVLMGDMCEVVDILSQNWTIPLGQDTGKIVDACFQNESLMDVLDLTDKFSFARGGINFPDINTSSATDFSTISDLSSLVEDTTDPFLVDGLLNDSLAELNDETGQSVGTCEPNHPNDFVANETLLTPWIINDDVDPEMPATAYMIEYYHNDDNDCLGPYFCTDSQVCPFSAYVGEIYTQTSGFYIVKVESEVFLAKLLSDVHNIVTFANDFADEMISMAEAINTVKHSLENSLIKDVDEFEAAMYCTFVADGFDEVFTSLCGGLMPSLTMLSLLLYLVGFFLIPVNVCLIIAVKRLKARGSGSLVANSKPHPSKEKDLGPTKLELGPPSPI